MEKYICKEKRMKKMTLDQLTAALESAGFEIVSLKEGLASQPNPEFARSGNLFKPTGLIELTLTPVGEGL